MKTIYIVSHNNEHNEYYANKEDAIRRINATCDAYKMAQKQQGVTLIYEPNRKEFEQGYPINKYYSEIQFNNQASLILKLEKATLY